VIILFDNIGYKVLGRQASYDQGIVVILPRLDLIINSAARVAMEERKEGGGRGEDVTEGNQGTELSSSVDVDFLPRDVRPLTWTTILAVMCC